MSQSLISRWRRPMPQVLLVGFVMFCCPGMFNAIQGIGAGGAAASNQSLVAKANASLYAFFSVVALFGGALINKFGPRLCLSVGCLSYGLYIGSLWSLARTGNEGFVIFSGCLLGVGAAFLWNAQGAVTMGYPVEAQRARAFSYQLVIYTLGASLGGLIALGDAVGNNELSAVNTGTYIAFIVIVIVGSVASLSLANPDQVRRNDGTPVQLEVTSKWSSEMIALGKLLRNKAVLLMLPAFIASNWYYAYFFSINAYYFSLRGRSLNAALFWAVEPLGTFLMSGILDLKKVNRPKRGLLGLAILSVCVVAVWTGGGIFQSTFDRNDVSPKRDWRGERNEWGKAFTLYVSYGFVDAMFATYCSWIIGTQTNDAQALARYSGIYRCVQSAGAALSFAVDAVETPFMTQYIINVVLVAGSLPLLAVVAWSIKPTNYGTEAGVASPIDWEQAVGRRQKPSEATFVAGTGTLSPPEKAAEA